MQAAQDRLYRPPRHVAVSREPACILLYHQHKSVGATFDFTISCDECASHERAWLSMVTHDSVAEHERAYATYATAVAGRPTRACLR